MLPDRTFDFKNALVNVQINKKGLRPKSHTLWLGTFLNN